MCFPPFEIKTETCILLRFSSDRQYGGRYAIFIYKTTNSYFVIHYEKHIAIKVSIALDTLELKN